MIFRAIVFDLEGTMIDVEMAHHLGHLEVARHLGLTIDLDEAKKRIPEFVGGGDESIARELRTLTKSSQSEEDIFRLIKEAYKNRLHETKVRARPGVTSFIGEVERARIPFALGSLTPRDEAIYLLRESGLDTLFRSCPKIYREHVHFTKPDPEVFLRTAEALSVAANEQLIFEDSLVGVQAGVLAGSIVIAVPAPQSGISEDDFRAAGARHVFCDWREVKLEFLLQL